MLHGWTSESGEGFLWIRGVQDVNGAMLRKSYMAPLGIRSIVNDPMTPRNGLSSIDIINDVYQYIYINHIT